MNLSRISTAIALSVAHTDIFNIADDSFEFSATLPVNTRDSFEHNGETREIVRTRNETPNIVVPLGAGEGEANPTLVKDAFVAEQDLVVTISGASISEQKISGASYEVSNPSAPASDSNL